jgi:acyl dehydratase
VRLLSNVVDVDPELVRVGMPVDLLFRKVDAEMTLPLFRPRCPEPRQTSLRFDEVEVGQELPLLPIPITSTLIVAGAIASRDFTPVHHDVAFARAQGSADIFMNIMTTNGLCSRYVTDWTGPDAVLRKLSVRLGVPNYPGDTMTFSGKVTSKAATSGGGTVEVSLRGTNRLGDHVTGSIVLELPNRS